MYLFVTPQKSDKAEIGVQILASPLIVGNILKRLIVNFTLKI